MDIIMNYVAFAGISEIDNIFGATIRHMAIRVCTQDDITNEENEILGKFLTFTREQFKGKEFDGKAINEPG